MNLQEIGILKTPFSSAEGTPIQPAFAKDCAGEAIIKEEFREGLKDLEGFSHAWLIYGFHCQENTKLTVTPFMADIEVGVFATRSPARPNKMGLTLVEIRSVSDKSIQLKGVDMLDGTPLFDIKPFFGKLEIPDSWETGWMDETKNLAGKPRVADKRFC